MAASFEETNLAWLEGAVDRTVVEDHPKQRYLPETTYDLIDWQSINANQRAIDVDNTLTEDGTPLSVFTGTLTPQTILEANDDVYFPD